MRDKFGRYQIKDEIGRGGMATVYLAHDSRLGTDVALKVLPHQLSHDPNFRIRFEQEARAIAKLREQAAIVPIYDYGEEEDQPFLVMRYLDGGSLANSLKQHGAFSLHETIPVIDRLASALDAAHQKGIIHRDIKPANILFDKDGNAYLSDFGIVRISESTANMTGSAIIGTPAYMSPEQIHGDKAIDGRSDIYMLGIILFEMLTGEPPYQADTHARVMMAHLMNPVPRILDRQSGLPPDCQIVINRAMAKQREARYPNAGALAADLHRVAAGQPLTESAMGLAAAATLIDTGAQQPAPPTAIEISPTRLPAEETALTTGAVGGGSQSGATLPPQAVQRKNRRFPLWAIGLLVVLLLVAVGAMAANQFSGDEQSAETAPAVIVISPTSDLAATETAVALAQPPTDAPAPEKVAAVVLEPSSTPEPTATMPLTATPQFRPNLRIKVPSASLRFGPGVSFEILEFVFVDDEVMAFAKNRTGAWYEVLLETGREGWLAASVTEPLDGFVLAEIPVALNIPTRKATTAVTEQDQTTPTVTVTKTVTPSSGQAASSPDEGASTAAAAPPGQGTPDIPTNTPTPHTGSPIPPTPTSQVPPTDYPGNVTPTSAPPTYPPPPTDYPGYP